MHEGYALLRPNCDDFVKVVFKILKTTRFVKSTIDDDAQAGQGIEVNSIRERAGDEETQVSIGTYLMTQDPRLHKTSPWVRTSIDTETREVASRLEKHHLLLQMSRNVFDN